ncbi:MAG: efflux transporter periplasmic adaptor subunit [Rhizobiales bacterium 64-17]|nr:MAG: efflux transporter periplasmic adaptor subunit [Rhizobiales bacterium 64-17]
MASPNDPARASVRPWQPSPRQIAVAAVVAVCAVAVAGFAWRGSVGASPTAHTKAAPRTPGTFEPTAAQWKTLTVEPVRWHVFTSQNATEGKITVNEDRSTPIYSPYSGRVKKLLARPGDELEAGQPLFVLEATDAVQVHNDFMAAVSALAKARSQLKLSGTVEARQRELYEGKAVALKDLQQAQADLAVAQSDVRSAESALEAARNRLRILGRTDEEIARFEQQRSISSEMPIVSPISGTVVQRKVGPGQYISSGSADPVYLIGDLSSVWLIAYVREIEAPKVHVGQTVRFTVLAYPERIFTSNVTYVATSLDPATRRLMVRATIDNADGALKPEMYATVTILTGEGDASLAIPRDSVIYEGDTARVWVTRDRKTAELKKIDTGLLDGKMIQVNEGLSPEDQIITRGSLFIDRAASGS